MDTKKYVVFIPTDLKKRLDEAEQKGISLNYSKMFQEAIEHKLDQYQDVLQPAN